MECRGEKARRKQREKKQREAEEKLRKIKRKAAGNQSRNRIEAKRTKWEKRKEGER